MDIQGNGLIMFYGSAFYCVLWLLDMANVDSDPGLEPLRLTVNTVPANRISDTDLHHAPIRDRLKPLSEKLHNTKAEFPFKFEAGGVANVCLKSSAKKPMIYGLRITSNEELPNEVKEEEEKADLNMHLSHMERELQRITRALTYVLKEADVNKDQDELFHKQTLALHESTTFWPIVQVCVLLSTGFAQARHIVKFFKSRRII